MKHLIAILAILLLVGATSAPPAGQPGAPSPATLVQPGEKEIKMAYYHLRLAAASETRTDFLRHFQTAIDALEKVPESAALAKAIMTADKQDVLSGLDALVESNDLSSRTAQGLKQRIEETRPGGTVGAGIGGAVGASVAGWLAAHREETKYTMMLAKVTLLETELLRTINRLGSGGYEGDDMDAEAYGTSIRDIAGGAFDGAVKGGGLGAAGGAALGSGGGAVVGGIFGGFITLTPAGAGAGAGAGGAIGGGAGTIVGGGWGTIIGTIIGIIWEITEPKDDPKDSETKETEGDEGDGLWVPPGSDPDNPCNDPFSGVLC